LEAISDTVAGPPVEVDVATMMVVVTEAATEAQTEVGEVPAS